MRSRGPEPFATISKRLTSEFWWQTSNQGLWQGAYHRWNQLLQVLFVVEKHFSKCRGGELWPTEYYTCFWCAPSNSGYVSSFEIERTEKLTASLACRYQNVQIDTTVAIQRIRYAVLEAGVRLIAAVRTPSAVLIIANVRELSLKGAFLTRKRYWPYNSSLIVVVFHYLLSMCSICFKWLSIFFHHSYLFSDICITVGILLLPVWQSLLRWLQDLSPSFEYCTGSLVDSSLAKINVQAIQFIRLLI